MSRDQPEAPSPNELRAFAYRLLGRREYSTSELAQRIRQKWPESEGIDTLIESLVAENLLSDDRYVESFVRFRKQRFQGPLKIKAALGAKGVSESLVSDYLEVHAREWSELAAEWLERQNIGAIDFDGKKKYYRRLTSRGFTHDQAMDALNRTHSTLD